MSHKRHNGSCVSHDSNPANIEGNTMSHTRESARQYTKRKAQEQGRRDRTNDKPCNPSKYNALEHSDRALWYRQGYFEQEELTMRITNKHLEQIVARLNSVTGNPEQPYVQVPGGDYPAMQAQIGNYHISGAYGGVCLHQMATEGGGVHDVFRCGHIPKRDLYERMHAYLQGIEDAKQ